MGSPPNHCSLFPMGSAAMGQFRRNSGATNVKNTIPLSWISHCRLLF